MSDRFFFGWVCGGAGVGAGWAAVVGGCVDMSGCAAVAAVGGALLVGVLVGVVGEVGAVGLAVLALYMGGRCLNWPGNEAEAALGAVDSSDCRFVVSRTEPPAFAIYEGKKLGLHTHLAWLPVNM